jgi:hypothetical protein
MSFQNIQDVDTVVYRGADGKKRGAKVNPLLIFTHHVVVNRGNNGTLVNDRNFVSVIKGKKLSP